ncbi:hypothetical protein CR513_23608, partial [Mucuna pruriens]
MASSSFHLKDLSPKARLMMEYMKKLEEKIEKLEGGLESIKLDSHSVNAKIRSWSKKQEKEEEKNDDNESCNIKSHRREKLVERHERTIYELKKNPWDIIKDKIPPFTRSANELKVAQNLDCINCEDLTKVKLIPFSFEDYAQVWWNEFALQIRDTRRASTELWEELKQEMKERFVPSYYKQDLFIKL